MRVPLEVEKQIGRYLLPLYLVLFMTNVASGLLNRIGIQLSPFFEWGFGNWSFREKPFDLVASVTFVHQSSGETPAAENVLRPRQHMADQICRDSTKHLGIIPLSSGSGNSQFAQ